MKTLYIVASPRGERSKSVELANHVLARLGGEITTVDLYNSFVPYLSEQVIAFVYGFVKYEDLSPENKKVADVQRVFIDQLKSADNLVIAAPMWNFGMPAALKAWFDLIIKVGETFSMNNGARQGIVKNIKHAIVTGARGGVYIDTPAAFYDMLTGHIHGLLGFIGIENTKAFWIEGVNALPEALPENMANVKSDIDAYFAV